MTSTTPASTPAPTPRHPMAAFAGGVCCPGLGLVMTGRFSLGLLAVALWFMVYLVAPIVVIDHAPDLIPKLPKIVLASNAAVWLGAALLAAGLAFKDGARARRPYEHVWWLFGFFLVVFFGFSQVRTRLLDPQVSMRPIADTALRPWVKEGQLLVIQKRGFDAGAAAINELVAVKDAGRALNEEGTAFDYGYARVIAKAGAVVEVKEDGGIVVDGFPVIDTPCDAKVPAAGHSCVHEKQATTAGAAERDTTATSFARAFPPTSVGAGQLFVLPDDRGRKLRAPAGLVNVTDVVGRVIIAEQR